MTRIKAISQKTPPLPPPALKEQIDLFAECPEDELASHLSEFTKWDYPKGDLHQWIPALNRFDQILEDAVRNHGFREGLNVQKTPFPEEMKTCLCQIMRVTALLFGNCSYRTIYGSAQHIYDLLGSTDLDVLEGALRLVTCFAARTAQRPDPTNSNFVIPKNRLWKFVTGEAISSRQPPFPDLKSLLSKDVVIPHNWPGYYFHYYSRAPSTSLSASVPPRSALNTQMSPLTPTPKSRDGGDSSQRGESQAASEGRVTEGWVRLYISPENVAKKGIEPTLQELVSQTNIPKDDEFRLFVQILIVHYYSDATRREQFLRCQLYAICSLANVSDSNTMEKQLFNPRPDILQQLTRLLHNDSDAGLVLKTIVLKTLRTLARNSIFASNRRSELSRFHQILNVLDSGLNHGILMTLLRENVALLQSHDPSVEQMQYAQALHRLVREFLESPQGASNLGFAGIVPLLVDILKIERPSVWNIVVTVADLLGALLPHQRHNQLLPLFIDADGLLVLIQVIKRHVDQNLVAEPQENGLHHSVLSFPEHQTLHTFLNLLHRLLKTGHGERVRNVVDSEVIGSLRTILENLKIFGGFIGMLASKLLAVIIHNEPTSYSALHESGLPQAFLKMVANGIPATQELIATIPNVFDAVCINAQGKELFSRYNFDGFFRVFESIEHCKVMTKGHCASDTGAGMDELIRHHPELKDIFLNSLLKMMEYVCKDLVFAEPAMGPKLPEMVDMAEATGDEESLSRHEEERNIPVLLLVRNVFFFAEGFFSTSHWIKDFLKENGHILLLDILNAPSIPYDFAETRDGYCLRNLMVLFVDQNGPLIIPHLLDVTRNILTDVDNCGVSLPLTNIAEPGDSELDLPALNKLLRLYSKLQSHLAILQSIYIQTTNMQGRPSVPYTVPFQQPENVEMLGVIGNVIRHCYLRGNRLLRATPKNYRDALPLDTLGDYGRRRSEKNEISDEAFVKKYGFSRRDPMFRNVEMLQYFIVSLPKKALKFFAGLSNSLVSRQKLADLVQRSTATAVTDKISDILLDLLRCEEGDKPIDKYLYWFCTMSFVHNTLSGGVDPRQLSYDKSSTLQVLLLNRFFLKGGLKAILDIISHFAEQLPQFDQNEVADSEALVALQPDLRKAFSLVRLFITSEAINESHQTSLMATRDRYKDQGHYFLLSAFLTETRAACLPVFTNLLSLLAKLDKATTQPLLSILSDLLLGGPEEFFTEANKFEGDPDEESIQRIVEHGFDRGQAYAALMTHANVEMAALDYLLRRRNPQTNIREGDLPPPSRSVSPPHNPDERHLAPEENQEANTEPIDKTEPGRTEPSDTRMQVDLTAGKNTSAADNDKLIEDSETRAEALARLRTDFSNDLENYITDILVHHPDLPFELALLIQSVGKMESNEWLQEKMLLLAARLASLEDDRDTKSKEITACAHVLGLLLNQPRYYKAAESSIVDFLGNFADFLTVEEGQEAPWMAPVLFILEVVMREAEWRLCQKQEKPLSSDTDVTEIEDEFHSRLLEKLIDILESSILDETVIVCVLRLLVRLTREGQHARRFRERNGLQSLLKLNHRLAGKTALKISDPSIIIIRHVVEDDKIILATIRSMVQSVMDTSLQRGRHSVDLNELLRNKYAEVLRNPELFSQAVEQLTKLSGWTSSNPQSQKLSKKPTESASAENEQTKGNGLVEEIKLPPPETPKKLNLELSYSSGVVQVLLTELLHQADALAPSKKDETPKVNGVVSEVSDDASTVGAAPAARPSLSAEDAKEYAYTLFLLQILSELLGSYNNCKLEFVNYSKRVPSREPLTPSKPRSMMLNFLLNDLLPTGSASYTYSAQAVQDLDLEKKRGISAISASVISALCKKTPEFYENDDRPDLLLTVRKFVLEGVARSIKDTLASTGPAQVRYSRYTSIADLCRKLLSSPGTAQAPGLQSDPASASEMARLMFEKGFVGLLTSVVADIELDFPDVRAVVNDILSSLRELAIAVNKLAANSTIEPNSATGDIDEISTASSVSDTEEMQERDETPDVFRNSALGILQGDVQEHGHHHDHDHDHLDYGEYDEEMDYDEDEDDDDDEDDLGDSGSDDEMDEDGEDDDLNVRAVEIIMGDDGDDDGNGGSEHTSDSSSDSEDMDDDEDDVEDDGESDGNSIIDMLEEQQMEADQVDGADGWTTDTDSVEEGEELDEDESNEDEFGGFPPPPIPVLDEDELDYSEDDLDDGADADEVRQMMGNLEGEIFDPMPDEEDEEEHMHHHEGWLLPGRSNTIRHGGGFQLGGGLFSDQRARTTVRRSVFPPTPAASASLHPMMVNSQAQPQTRPAQGVGMTRHIPQLAGAPPDLLRSMEHLFGMQHMLTDLMEQLGEGHQATISFELRSNPNGPNLMPRILRMRHQLGGPLAPPPEEALHPFKMASSLLYVDTSTRWQQAATMWYQKDAAERAAIFQRKVFKLLHPAALEEEKARKAKEEADRKAAEVAKKEKEEEERRKAQEEAEAKAKEEEERRQREEAENRAREEQRLAEEQAERERAAADASAHGTAELTTDGSIAMDGIETATSAPSVPVDQQDQSFPAGAEEPTAEVTTTQRIFATIRGNRVDITGLGVDPEFLEALPEEIREEVLYQHIRDRRAAAPPDQPSTLDPSFLDALPADIRAELLEEEAAERRRQERAAQRQQAAPGSATASGGPVDLDPASFIASLEGPLRHAVLLDQDDDFLAQLPPHIVAEANALRERVGHRFGHPLFGHRHPFPAEIRRKPPTPRRKDGIQLLEKSGLATLVRLTFLRNRPEALQDILLELCRHRHTRVEVVGLLLSILQDGSADVAAVERSFSQLSVKAKGQDQGVSPVKPKTKMDSSFIAHISGENSPTLIARHCLELLNHLIKNNHSLPFYFLTEHESQPALKRVNSKKGKGKEVVTKESRYPINALLSLLERSAILDTKGSTEEFARLLSDVTKPLLTLQRKGTDKAGDKPEKADDTPAAEQPATQTSESVAPPPAVETQEQPVIQEAGTSADGGASSSAPKGDTAAPVRTLTPPLITEHNLELLVRILVAKEVSRETFRSTLATMHHLMAVPGALEVFGRGLAREAQRYGDIAQADLWAISQKFEKAREAGHLKDVDLTEYTSRGADQTKLLKIFKAIDYLFNRIQKDDGDDKEKSDEAAATNRQSALAIYSQLSLNPLWENLSTCLGYLRDNPDTWPLAQPLLPMIESLLVACNHINTSASGKRIASSPEAEHMESLFFKFTEDHRKILNYLVHMQPNLMSGSFEMLAHNPKVLEFDNKRNYFNRKLHDRKGQRVPSRSISLNIRRDMVFLDSFRSLCFRSGEEIKNARLNVRFQGEEGVDAGGLTREWYQVLARQMFDPNYALFTPVSSDSATFHPNKSSYVNDEHLMFFKFVGRIIGKALYDGRLLDCHFSRAVYKHILNRPISVKDLEYYDNTYYKNLMWMLENPINDIVVETFSIEAEEYGVTHIIDLVPDGRTIPVTDENKAEYVRLVSEYRLQTSVKDQLKEFLTGFHDIIPADLVSIFTEQELELLISGLPDIDIEDWKAHSTYSNYDASSPQIQWFWRAVRSFDKEERAKLLQFATGTSKVPLNGFKELEGMQGTTKFTIVRDFGHKSRLPQSHTCFNQIDLPEYDSYEQLRTALLTAITMGTEGFGFA